MPTAGLTPLFHTNMTPYGEVQLRRDGRLDLSDASREWTAPRRGDGRRDARPRPLQPRAEGLWEALRQGDRVRGNPVAVDVIAAEVVGIPKKLLYVERVAEHLGIPGADRSTIRTSGVSLDEAKVGGFRLPHSSDVQWGLPPFLKNRLRRHLTSRPYAIEGKCRLCGICRDACPPRAIDIRSGELHFDYDRCIRCFCCRELCPHGALGAREGVLARLMRKCI